MEKEKFDMLVEKAFENLPSQFKSRLDNIHVIVEDLPDDMVLASAHVRNKYGLLGLYSGVPYGRRGVDYGVYPVLPDRIILFKENIERTCRNDEEIEERVEEVLIHEVAHYFGMTDEEIRKAGY
jgi:predicted Zn-dependent protease with MMP-like domain